MVYGSCSKKKCETSTKQVGLIEEEKKEKLTKSCKKKRERKQQTKEGWENINSLRKNNALTNWVKRASLQKLSKTLMRWANWG